MMDNDRWSWKKDGFQEYNDYHDIEYWSTAIERFWRRSWFHYSKEQKTEENNKAVIETALKKTFAANF